MSDIKSIVFLGSKPVGYQCLQYLIERSISLSIRVAAVLTQARKEFSVESDVEKLAREAGIPVIKSLEEIPTCDLIYSVQYHKILAAAVIEKAHMAAVNLHMAPLPEYRGSNQFSYAIIDGKREFGTTIHLIDERIDHGDILFQKRFPIPEDCWIETLYQLTEAASVALFKESLAAIISGNFSPVPQATMEAQYGSTLHFKKDINYLKQIDLSWDSETIGRRIRATSMPGFEPPYTMIAGRKIHFTIGE